VFYQVSVSFHKDFIEVKGDQIKIGVMERPLKGKANMEIVKKIAKHFDISKSNVRIVAGERSKNKVVEVTN